METAASLITLIAFSLQSTKLVYQTIDDIRDGPSVITSLAESTKRLESILQQLLQLINHSGQSQQAHGPTTWKPLQQKISECSNDMQEASNQLNALNPNGAKHQVDRAWKRVKLSLKDNFFTRLDGQVKSHLAELGLQLQIVNTHYGVSRDARETQQHHTSETFFRTITNQLSLQSTSLHDHVTEKAQGIEASLTTLVTGVNVADKNRVEESRQLRDSFEQINDTLTNRLNQNEQSSRQLVQLSNEQIAAQFDQLHAMSADQSQTILDLLHQIRGCLKNEPSTASPADKDSNTKAQDTLDSVTSKDRGGALSAAIDRLCRYTSNTTTTYDSDEADDIIDDLEYIINALLDHDATNPGAAHSEPKRKRHADNGDPDVPREIKKIRGILTASRAVEVYGSGPARTGRSSHGPRNGTRHSMEVYEIANCTAVVSIARGTYDKTLVLKYGKEYIDWKMRDENGQDYFHRMLFIDPMGRLHTNLGNTLSQNITLLLAHGADLGTRDLFGRSCLHTLLSNDELRDGFDYHYVSSETIPQFQVIVNAISALIRMGADIYAVDNVGFSVTEWAHYIRVGEAWDSALEEAGWDVEQVYQKDHRNGRKVSDDIFAPGKDWPRQKGSFQWCSSSYNDIPFAELLKRTRKSHSDFSTKATQIETESEESDESSSVTEENAKEKHPDLKPELSLEVDNQNNIIDHPLDSDSDEEMGGVPITAAG
ncbi:MAG: hypothetical protein Q9211_005144 [Gyalolechia sp. 1 TL-2023]